MNCPSCKCEVKNAQKNTLTKCSKCGATLMCVKIGDRLIIDDVSKDRRNEIERD